MGSADPAEFARLLGLLDRAGLSSWTRRYFFFFSNARQFSSWRLNFESDFDGRLAALLPCRRFRGIGVIVLPSWAIRLDSADIALPERAQL